MGVGWQASPSPSPSHYSVGTNPWMHAHGEGGGGAIGFREASGTSLPATRYVRGPVAQWTTRLTTNQKIAGSSPAGSTEFYVARNQTG